MIESPLTRLLKFYDILNRPLTFWEIYGRLESFEEKTTSVDLMAELARLVKNKKISENGGFYYPSSDKNLARRHQDVLLDKKWKKFLRRVKLFGHVPFVQAVFAAGSMSLGNVRSKSDFDVIVVSRIGRIFSARFFCTLFFGLLNWRRSGVSHKKDVSDKICLSHFVTANSLTLKPPRNIYWQELYYNLVPLSGRMSVIGSFVNSNRWAMLRSYLEDRRKLPPVNSLIRKMLEKILGGNLGNHFETFMKNIQMKRILGGVGSKAGYEPRLVFTDDELEFHPDTKRISDWMATLEKN